MIFLHAMYIRKIFSDFLSAHKPKRKECRTTMMMFGNLIKRNVNSTIRPLMFNRTIMPLQRRTFYQSALFSQQQQEKESNEKNIKDTTANPNVSATHTNEGETSSATTTTTATATTSQTTDSSQQQEQQQQRADTGSQQQQQQEKQYEESEETQYDSEKKEKSFFERVFTVRNMLLPVTAGVVLGIFYFYDPRQEYRDRQVAERQQKQKSIKTVGAPAIGGSFTLVDTKGRPITDSEFRGKWMLVYFGFTNCPDICPEEMRKMTRALHDLEKRNKEMADQIVPIFITCDPNRDSIQAVDLYLKEGFHERFVGLTGTPEQVKKACQRYRVYYSAPDFAEGKDDYLVDHSVFFYLMNPYGHFKEYFAKSVTAEDVSQRLEQILKEYEEQD